MGGKFERFEVVKAGAVTKTVHRHKLMRNCSLQIAGLLLSDAQLYTCDSGKINSSVSLKILQVTEKADPATGTIELHCFLSSYKGYEACDNSTGVHIRWSSEDGSPLNGDRFRFDYPSHCFSKLIIAKKPTDHRRKWKCHLTHDHVLTVTSYTTTVKDGLEEVVAAVGQSVSLSCNTSSLDVEVSVEWTVCENPLTDRNSPDCGQIRTSHEMKDSSLVISKLKAVHAGQYQCSESGGQHRALDRIRLHTLDVVAASGPGGDNLTLMCVLTCATQCEKDFNLTWSKRNHRGQQSELIAVNNTLVRTLFLPVGSVGDEMMCSAYREGALMASKEWQEVNSLQTPAWLALPVGLLICAAAGGIYICMKRRRKKAAAKDSPSIGMTHVYDVIQDNDEEQQQSRQRQEAGQATDDFYHLLQPVN
ncbi:uncharacterized protein LOC115396775 isoform X2 [Salarias fasciatus]|nr:uncharacterized protein LOC115396775 isoform X2 [Salarias fasciatus]